jgi:hypothetical protein
MYNYQISRTPSHVCSCLMTTHVACSNTNDSALTSPFFSPTPYQTSSHVSHAPPLRRNVPSFSKYYLHPTIQNPSLHSPRRSHMAPPWVTFDSIAYFNGSCANGADPDIASLGVLVSPHPHQPQLTRNRSSSPSCSLA